MLIIGLVVVLAAGGTMTWLLVGAAADGDSAEQPLAGTVDWRSPKPSAKLPTIGSWSDAGTVVHLTTETMTAYTHQDGTQDWTLTPGDIPGPAPDVFCGMSSSAVRGLGAVSYGVREPADGTNPACYGIMLVDISSGKIRWNTDLSRTGYTGLAVDNGLHMDIAGNMVVYAHIDKVAALHLADGTKSWTYTDPACSNAWDHEASGQTATAVLQCDLAGTGSREKLVNLDTSTGSVIGSTVLPEETIAKVVSAEPAVLDIFDSGNILDTKDRYVVYNRSAERQATIPYRSKAGNLDRKAVSGTPIITTVHPQYRVIIAHGMLVTLTHMRRSPESNIRFTNEIVAFDLDTGKLRWSQSLGATVAGVPFAATPDGVLAVNNGTYEIPAQVMLLSWADGSITPAGKPYPRKPILYVMRHDLHWEGDAVYAISFSGQPSRPTAFALK